MRPSHLVFVVLINLIWGFNIVTGKVGVIEFKPMLFTFLRFALLALVLAPFLRIHRGRMWLVFWIAMTTGGLHFAFIYAGLYLVDDVSTVAIAIQLVVPFSTILSIIFLKEVVGWKRRLGILLSFSGVLILGFDPRVIDYAGGLTLVVIAAMSGSVGFLLMKKLAGLTIFELQAWIAAYSWPVMLLLSVLFESDQLLTLRAAGIVGWGAVIYTALFASLVGHGGMYYLMQRYDLSQLAPLTLLATLFAVVFGVLLLGDTLTDRMLIGGLLTTIGVFVIAMRQRQVTGDE